MKILQIIQRPQLRGAEIFACQLSLELQKLGHTVDVLILFGGNNADLPYELNYLSLAAVQKKRFWDFSAYSRLSKIINSGEYDIVQANAGDTLKYASLSKKLYHWKAKLVFRNANKMSAFISSAPHLWLNRFFLREIDFAISVSENCRQDLIALYPPAKNISETGTIGTFDFSEVQAANKGKDQNKIWINVGSFVKEKNHSFLLEVFDDYLSDHAENELWLVGDGKLRTQLEERVKELGIGQNVKFLGYQKNAVEYIKAAEIMVMPSMIEGLPGVILEALSCGIPVIASDVGGIPEVIHNEVNGYVIEGYSVKDYKLKIGKVLNDNSLQENMSQNAQKLISSKFLMPQIASHFEGLYEKVIQT